MEEKWNEMYCYEVFDKDGWTICLRPRTNRHLGEPDMNVWVMLSGREVARYTNEYRGYDSYEDEEKLPNAVRKCARKAWKKLCEGRYTDENLEKVRNRYFMKHHLNNVIKEAPVSL